MNKGENNLYQRVFEIISISDIVNAHPIFISEFEHIPIIIPMIHQKEFKSFKSYEELVQRL